MALLFDFVFFNHSSAGMLFGIRNRHILAILGIPRMLNILSCLGHNTNLLIIWHYCLVLFYALFHFSDSISNSGYGGCE